jgi:hypothetical protein
VAVQVECRVVLRANFALQILSPKLWLSFRRQCVRKCVVGKVPTHQKILLKHQARRRVRPVSSRITSLCTFKVTWTFRGPCQLSVWFHGPIENNRNSSKLWNAISCMTNDIGCVSHRVQCRICYIDSCLNQLYESAGIQRVVVFFSFSSKSKWFYDGTPWTWLFLLHSIQIKLQQISVDP